MGSDLSVSPTKKAAGSEALLKAVSCWVRNQCIIRKVGLLTKSSERVTIRNIYKQ